MPDKHEVGGSSPLVPTKPKAKARAKKVEEYRSRSGEVVRPRDILHLIRFKRMSLIIENRIKKRLKSKKRTEKEDKY